MFVREKKKRKEKEHRKNLSDQTAQKNEREQNKITIKKKIQNALNVTLVATKQYAWTQKRTQRKIRISNASKEESSCPSHMICTRIWTVRVHVFVVVVVFLMREREQEARSKRGKEWSERVWSEGKK